MRLWRRGRQAGVPTATVKTQVCEHPRACARLSLSRTAPPSAGTRPQTCPVSSRRRPDAHGVRRVRFPPSHPRGDARSRQLSCGCEKWPLRADDAERGRGTGHPRLGPLLRRPPMPLPASSPFALSSLPVPRLNFFTGLFTVSPPSPSPVFFVFFSFCRSVRPILSRFEGISSFTDISSSRGSCSFCHLSAPSLCFLSAPSSVTKYFLFMVCVSALK